MVAPGVSDADERFAMIGIDPQTSVVSRVSAAMSGPQARQLLIARGETRWCVESRLALARTQWAGAECERQLAPTIRPMARRAPGAVE